MALGTLVRATTDKAGPGTKKGKLLGPNFGVGPYTNCPKVSFGKHGPS